MRSRPEAPEQRRIAPWRPNMSSARTHACPGQVALVEAASNPAGEVRTLARQCLLQHLANVPTRSAEVDKLLQGYPDTKKSLAKDQLKPGGLPASDRWAPSIRHGETGAAVRNGRLSSEADSARGERGGGPAPKKPSLLKRLSTKSSLKVGGTGTGGSSTDGSSLRDVASMTAAEQMLALKARQAEMSEEEYQAARERIIQSV